MKQIYFTKLFEYPIKEFKTHLEDNNNERIIFSGKYGIGKTRFLNDFFEVGSQNNLSIDYDVYKLNPVNYSIASNEDILRYIKYDIIIEMLAKQIPFDQIKLKYIDTLPEYVKKNFNKVLSALVYMIPKLGKTVIESFEKLDKLKEEYLKFHDENNKSSGDNLAEYLEILEAKEGSLFENDITTKIISETIKNRGKKTILLIDDFDRLDPEHIFRILNVFASHFDANSISGTKNKFNFDKIIIVCDFNNIRNLFHHRFGLNTDFMGYIDKFYSNDIYHFDNKLSIISIINKIIYSIEIKVSNKSFTSLYKNILFRNGFIFEMISLLIEKHYLNLRNLIKINGRTIEYHSAEIKLEKELYKFAVEKIPIIIQIRFIKELLGDIINMKHVFQALRDLNYFFPQYKYTFLELIYLLNYSKHNFSARQPFLVEFKDYQLVMEVKMGDVFDQFLNAQLYEFAGGYDNNIPIKGQIFVITTKNFWEALLNVIEVLNNCSFLN